CGCRRAKDGRLRYRPGCTHMRRSLALRLFALVLSRAQRAPAREAESGGAPPTRQPHCVGGPRPAYASPRVALLSPVSFDRVAPHYRWLETLAFGNQLQQARVAFVREIETPLRILIVGEGNGRFLTELMRTGEPPVDCVEMSVRMIALARKQVPDAHVNFIEADVRDLTLCQAHYDLIVSHFFFDCFTEGALAEIIARLANAAAPDAQWL